MIVACTHTPTPPTTPPTHSLVQLRSKIQQRLNTEQNFQTRCWLRLQEACIDLIEGKSFSASARQDCPDGPASFFDAITALLNGDPWQFQEKALRFLESTHRIDELHILWLRRLMVALLAHELDIPNESFAQRMQQVFEDDPSLPIFRFTDGHMHMALPQSRQKLGTGLTFHLTQRIPVAGRFSFAKIQESNNPESLKEFWQDGQLLAASSLHPERVRLELPLTCPEATPLLVEIIPEGPAIVQTSDGFFATTEHTLGVESRMWRLVIPPKTGPRVLTMYLAAFDTPRRVRVRVLPSQKCNFGVLPVLPHRLTPSIPEPYELVLLVQAAEDIALVSSRARKVLESWPQRNVALVNFLRVKAYLTDESLPTQASKRKALQILDTLPQTGWVLKEKAFIDLEDGHPEHALKRLSSLRSPWAIVEKNKIAFSIQSKSDGFSDLLTSIRHYRIFTTEATMTFHVDPVLALSRLRTAAALRPDRLDLMYGLLRLRLYTDALSEGQRLWELSPHANVAAALAQACRGIGDFACAKQWSRTHLALEPSSETAFLQWLDNSKAADANFREQETLEKHVQHFPTHRDVLLLYWPELKKRAMPLPNIQQLVQTHFGFSAPAVFLLNREEHFFSPTGGGIVLVTRWVRLNTPTAVEELGELELPSDAVVVEVHTRKPNGSVYPPSATPQKSSFSLRNLEPGDTVEFRYLLSHPPIAGMPTRTWSRRFFFAHRVFPTVLAQWILHAPPGVQPRILTQGNLPSPQQTNDAYGSHFLLSLWMREPQPNEVRMTQFIPQSVRAHAGFEENDVYALLAEENPRIEWDSWELQTLAKRLCPQKTMDCIARTAWWVQTHIRQENTNERPGHILERRAGSRSHLLYALLHHEGFTPRIALSRPERTAIADDNWPDPQDYPIILVHIPGFGFIDTRFSYLPPGHVVPALAGAKALLLSGKRDIATLDAARPQRRRLEIRVRLHADHSAKVSLRETAHGFFAVQKLEQIKGLSLQELKERIQTDSLRKTFPGAQVQSARWRHITPQSDDLELHVQFTAPSVSVATNGGFEIRRMGFPWNLAQRYLVFSTRKTDFLPDSLPTTHVEIVMDPPSGFHIENAPDLEVSSRFGYIRRRLHKDGKNARLIIEKHLETTIVHVSEWKDFADFCRNFDEIETLPIQMVPLPVNP